MTLNSIVMRSMENQSTQGFVDAIGPLQDQLALVQFSALLAIASEPGISVNELAARIGVPQPSASRYAAILMARYQAPEGAVPTMLATQEVNEDDPRRRALFLTEEAWEFLAKLKSVLSELLRERT